MKQNNREGEVETELTACLRSGPHVRRFAIRLDFGLQRAVSPADTTSLAQFASRSFVFGCWVLVKDSI